MKEYIRKVFLYWIERSMSNKEELVKTDYGLLVKFILSKKQLFFSIR